MNGYFPEESGLTLPSSCRKGPGRSVDHGDGTAAGSPPDGWWFPVLPRAPLSPGHRCPAAFPLTRGILPTPSPQRSLERFPVCTAVQSDCCDKSAVGFDYQARRRRRAVEEVGWRAAAAHPTDRRAPAALVAVGLLTPARSAPLPACQLLYVLVIQLF